MTTATMPDLPRAARHERDQRAARAERARRHFQAFVDELPPNRPYAWGRHTLAMCEVCEQALAEVEAGRSVYHILSVPVRHGKSDLASRRLPAWWLGRRPDGEVILTTYGARLAEHLSRDCQRCFKSDRYARVFPGLAIDRDRHAAESWGVADHGGGVRACGIGGGVTGYGGELLVVDDYFRNRAEAESQAVRDRVWNEFESTLMTRLAPVHAVLIVANRWGVDDVVGRIHAAMASDPNFPQFIETKFPACDDAGNWLFPERFDVSWYEKLRASMGSYAWSSQCQQDPRPRTGRLWRTDRIVLPYYADKAPDDCEWVRFWDPAGTDELARDDPDYTVGLKLGGRRNEQGQWELFVDDIVRGRWAAPERDRHIYATAEADGAGVRIGIETVGGYKDVGEYARVVLKGRRSVDLVSVSKNKVARAVPLEPVFEAAHVHVRRGPWTESAVAEWAAFPGGRHDDQADALSGAFAMLGGGDEDFVV